MESKEAIKHIETLEAYARLILEEATKLKKSLSLVQGRAPRKGPVLSKEAIAKALAKRQKALERNKK